MQKNTVDAPNAVTSQVKRAPKRARKGGGSFIKADI